MSIHLVISHDEKYAIVNALAYYDEMHTGNSVCGQDKEQWRLCFQEDQSDLGGTDSIDKLATKIATSF